MKIVLNKIIILSVLLLASCASLNPLDVLNPDKPSLEVNAQVGKTNEQEKNNIKVESGKTETKQEAESITNDTNYTAEKIENITQNIPLEYVLLLILLGGWCIPTPKETFKFASDVISWTINTTIITPIKAVSDFILKLFGRI